MARSTCFLAAVVVVVVVVVVVMVVVVVVAAVEVVVSGPQMTLITRTYRQSGCYDGGARCFSYWCCPYCSSLLILLVQHHQAEAVQSQALADLIEVELPFRESWPVFQALNNFCDKSQKDLACEFRGCARPYLVSGIDRIPLDCSCLGPPSIDRPT